MTWQMGLGFLGQAFFTARILLQWVRSEREGRVVVPRWFWRLSLAGSFFLLVYAVSLKNAVYVLSTLPGAFIYYRNLRIRNVARRRALLPVAAALLVFCAWAVYEHPKAGPPLWAAIGGLGALLWTSRFVLQWWISERKGVSVLPASFWAISLLGSALLLAYSIWRTDPVFILAYAFGFIPYARNLYLSRRDAPKPALQG